MIIMIKINLGLPLTAIMITITIRTCLFFQDFETYIIFKTFFVIFFQAFVQRKIVPDDARMESESGKKRK